MPDTRDKDACELLDADHLAVKHLFVEYARQAYAPSHEATDDRASIAATICDELTVHAQIEEEHFYPAVRQAFPEDADVVDEAEAEQQAAKALIAEVRARAAAPADAGLDQRVAELARAIEDHVKEERDELFPKARAAAGIDLAALGVEMRQRQEALKSASSEEPAQL